MSARGAVVPDLQKRSCGRRKYSPRAHQDQPDVALVGEFEKEYTLLAAHRCRAVRDTRLVPHCLGNKGEPPPILTS